jgi:hypothetical protein
MDMSLSISFLDLLNILALFRCTYYKYRSFISGLSAILQLIISRTTFLEIMAIELATKNTAVGISTINLFFALLIPLYRKMHSICGELPRMWWFQILSIAFCLLTVKLSHYLELLSSKIRGNNRAGRPKDYSSG